MSDNYNNEKKTISFHSYQGTIFSYSDGVKAIMEKLGGIGLVESMYINCHYDEERRPRFQIWRFNRIMAIIFSECTDGYTGELLQKNQFYHDSFPDNFSVWIFEGSIMLPSEFVQVCL